MSDNEERATPFDGARLQNGHFARADMTGTHFDGVNLADAKFFAVLSKAQFNDTNLAEAQFHDVNLGNADFNDVNLSAAVFQNINFSDASISNANLTGMRINGVLVSDLFEAYEKSQKP